MSTRKSIRIYFYHYILILCCLAFCLAAGPCCNEITITGKITCDAYTSGPIYVAIFKIDEGIIGSYSINDLNKESNYPITLPVAYLNTHVIVSAVWDHDDNFFDNSDYPTYTPGDYMNTYGGIGGELLLQCVNENIDININQKITASVSGVVTCDEYEDTGGGIKISAWDDESTTREHWVSMPGCTIPRPGSYKIYIRNVEPGNLIWVAGFWDKDGSGCFAYNTGDYVGSYPDNPITLKVETTGVGFDVCQWQVQ